MLVLCLPASILHWQTLIITAFVPQEMTNFSLFDTAVILPSWPSGVNQYWDCVTIMISMVTTPECVHTVCGLACDLVTDTNNAGCLMQDMFPITAKPKALGKFGADALNMKRDLFGLIIQHMWYIYTNKYLFILLAKFSILNTICMYYGWLNVAMQIQNFAYAFTGTEKPFEQTSPVHHLQKQKSLTSPWSSSLCDYNLLLMRNSHTPPFKWIQCLSIH